MHKVYYPFTYKDLKLYRYIKSLWNPPFFYLVYIIVVIIVS